MFDKEFCRSYLGGSAAFWDAAEETSAIIMGNAELECLRAALREALLENHDPSAGRRTMESLAECVKKISPGKQDLCIIPVLCEMLPEAIAFYRAQGTPEDVIQATFRDVMRWVSHYANTHDGKPGLNEYQWVGLHYAGELFEFGRLQYQKNRWEFSCFVWQLPDGSLCIRPDSGQLPPEEGVLLLYPGAPVLNLHIPAGERLSKETIDASLCAAAGFFRQQGYPSRIAVCDSWLLDPVLDRFLPEESNIRAFAARFTRLPGGTGSTAGRFLFRTDYTPKMLHEIQPQTALQRGVHAYLCEGGTLRDTAGFLFLPQEQ